MILSKNFTLSEFTKSKTADKLGIKNIPSAYEINNLKELVDNLLQPLRDLYGKPMTVNSGYRCPALNKAVGGVPTSDHVKGRAADIHCENPRALLSVLNKSGLAFDQSILYPTFLHLSYREGGNRKQGLFAKGVTG